MNRQRRERLEQLQNEIVKLHDLNEAEVMCLNHMSAFISMLGYSPELCTKLLKALAAMSEIALDDLKAEERKEERK
jgi:hypothetical protein